MADDQLGFALPGENDASECLFDPVRIRAEAAAMIAEARRAGGAAWDEDTIQFKKLIFPHLVSWLPDEAERNQLCFDFSEEMKRIEALLAA
jgi:hypothetical protein